MRNMFETFRASRNHGNPVGEKANTERLLLHPQQKRWWRWIKQVSVGRRHDSSRKNMIKDLFRIRLHGSWGLPSGLSPLCGWKRGWEMMSGTYIYVPVAWWQIANAFLFHLCFPGSISELLWSHLSVDRGKEWEYWKREYDKKSTSERIVQCNDCTFFPSNNVHDLHSWCRSYMKPSKSHNCGDV